MVNFYGAIGWPNFRLQLDGQTVVTLQEIKEYFIKYKTKLIYKILKNLINFSWQKYIFLPVYIPSISFIKLVLKALLKSIYRILYFNLLINFNIHNLLQFNKRCLYTYTEHKLVLYRQNV